MRSTFKVLFYVNGSKEKNGIVPINQSFSTDGAVCPLKQDREGRFDLNIDGVSHHS